MAAPTRMSREAGTLIIGCGSVLHGDDAAGPTLVQRMVERGVPPGVRCVDAGTGGVDVVLRMRGMHRVIVVDACRSGSEPGTLFQVAGDQFEKLSCVKAIELHSFRWDHAIAVARWLLKDDYPNEMLAYLIEGRQFEAGQPLTPAVDAAVDRLAGHLRSWLGTSAEIAEQNPT